MEANKKKVIKNVYLLSILKYFVKGFIKIFNKLKYNKCEEINLNISKKINFL